MKSGTRHFLFKATVFFSFFSLVNVNRELKFRVKMTDRKKCNIILATEHNTESSMVGVGVLMQFILLFYLG